MFFHCQNALNGRIGKTKVTIIRQSGWLISRCPPAKTIVLSPLSKKFSTEHRLRVANIRGTHCFPKAVEKKNSFLCVPKFFLPDKKMSSFPAWVWILSLAHAAIQTYYTLPFSIRYLAGYDTLPSHYSFCMCLFMGHIALDSLLHWKKLMFSMKAHHVITFTVAVCNYTQGYPEPAMVLLANETSTIFYSASKLFRPGLPRRVCRNLFAVTFFATRIVMNLLLMLKEGAPLTTTERRALATLLALNAYWFGKGLMPSKRTA